MTALQLGLDTFGDLPTDDATGRLLTHPEAIRRVVEEAVLADQVGLDVIALGEHHRPDFALSSPETVLAGIATRTERIRLASGVTVLSSDDPVRVFQRFATVDALSGGRAQVMLGRGSFTESFPLFGFDLQDYEVLFEEKIELFSQLLREEPVTWSGTTSTCTGGPPPSSAPPRAGSACTRTAWWPRPTRPRSRRTTARTSRCATPSARTAAGRRCAGRSSRPRSRTGRCTSARRRRSPARSPAPCAAWTSAGSTSSTPAARCG